MDTILVVDDDRTVIGLAQRALRNSGVTVISETTAGAGLEAIRRHHPDVLLLDVQLPDASGLEIAEQVREIDPRLPMVYITVAGTSDVAIEAMQRGAYEFLVKPLAVEDVQDVVERGLQTRRMMQVPVTLAEDPTAAAPEESLGDPLIGRSPQMMEVYKEIGRVAGQDVTVLIFGESGTGKELVARAIYQHSRRKTRPFLAVNCAALSETLLESELFGHEKGSFTGADRRRIGKFEQCHDGTIFLDEVGDMAPSVQSKVLRLLQEQKFERVGGAETIQTNVRIITATNRDLETMVEEGEFRLDLYHRLNDYRIDLPPLRERGEDLILLTQYFLTRFRRSLGKQVQDVSAEALARLKEYRWPGNVRELQTVLKRSVLKSSAPVLTPEYLPAQVGGQTRWRGDPSSSSDTLDHDLQSFLDTRTREGSTDLYAESLEMMERYLITRVLREAEGNQSKAAKRLGITRGSLRYKLRSLGIGIGHVVSSER